MNTAFKSPVEIAKGACAASQAKSSWSIPQLLIMGTLAGAYIAFAGFLATVVSQDLATYVGVGMGKFITGAVFSTGLMLVVIAGGELFTGNCMMVLGSFVGCQPFYGVARNWLWVYIANFLGSVLVAILIYYSGLWGGAVGGNAPEDRRGKDEYSLYAGFFPGDSL